MNLVRELVEFTQPLFRKLMYRIRGSTSLTSICDAIGELDPAAEATCIFSLRFYEFDKTVIPAGNLVFQLLCSLLMVFSCRFQFHSVVVSKMVQLLCYMVLYLMAFTHYLPYTH